MFRRSSETVAMVDAFHTVQPTRVLFRCCMHGQGLHRLENYVPACVKIVWLCMAFAFVLQDFVSAVMDVDYSPTGREFVAGGYDRSVRIFSHTGGHSREIYTTKRMQRVFCVKFSGDATYVYSGSDDMNVRVWKAEASEQLGVLLPRERQKQAYNKALVERFKHMPEVKRIIRDKKLPSVSGL